nr:integrase arm-type DNA-binding domain-containing protein [Nitrosomonas nitrosa]
MGKLQAIKLNSYPAGNHSDGNNLFLRVKPTGARSWVFRYKLAGKAIELGMGSLTIRSLAEARHLAIDMKRAVAAGKNPKNLLAPKRETKTFADYAVELIESKRPGWRNAKHAQQWINTLEQYAYPILGSKPIESITLDDIVAVLRPIWTEKPETASRLRSRVEAVLDFGYLHEGIDKSNPAGWRGRMDKIFAKPGKIKEPQHFHAIPYRDLPSIMAKLREQTSVGALVVRWIVLTASRSGEARLMTWGELDIEKRVWTVPGNRMKAGKAHRIPLSSECLEILRIAETFKFLTKDGLVFPNTKGKPLSDVVVSQQLKSASYQEATVHGTRSSFRDWSANETHYPREVCEAALAHSIGSVERAYRRSDLFEKRRELMEEWAGFLCAT